jgi:hypothetical protein
LRLGPPMSIVETHRRSRCYNTYILGGTGKESLYSIAGGENGTSPSCFKIAEIIHRDEAAIVAESGTMSTATVSPLYIAHARLITKVETERAGRFIDPSALAIGFKLEDEEPGLLVVGQQDQAWRGTMLVLTIDARSFPVVLWTSAGERAPGPVVPAPPLTRVAEASR